MRNKFFLYCFVLLVAFSLSFIVGALSVDVRYDKDYNKYMRRELTVKETDWFKKDVVIVGICLNDTPDPLKSDCMTFDEYTKMIDCSPHGVYLNLDKNSITFYCERRDKK